MAKNYLDKTGLAYLWEKISAIFVKKDGAKVLSTNDYTTAEKTKLAGLSNYTLPKASTSVLGGVMIGSGLTIDSTGKVNATGTNVTIDSALSSSSTNPVQNKIITTELGKKMNTSDLIAITSEEIDIIIEG